MAQEAAGKGSEPPEGWRWSRAVGCHLSGQGHGHLLVAPWDKAHALDNLLPPLYARRRPAGSAAQWGRRALTMRQPRPGTALVMDPDKWAPRAREGQPCRAPPPHPPSRPAGGAAGSPAFLGTCASAHSLEQRTPTEEQGARGGRQRGLRQFHRLTCSRSYLRAGQRPGRAGCVCRRPSRRESKGDAGTPHRGEHGQVCLEWHFRLLPVDHHHGDRTSSKRTGD